MPWCIHTQGTSKNTISVYNHGSVHKAWYTLVLFCTMLSQLQHLVIEFLAKKLFWYLLFGTIFLSLSM